MIVIITMTILTRSNSTQPPLPNDVVPSILLSPPVLDQVNNIILSTPSFTRRLCLCAKSQPDKRICQVVGAVTKALAVDDKKEAILVGATDVIFVINHILNQFG